MSAYFTFGRSLPCRIPADGNEALIRELFQGGTFGVGALSITKDAPAHTILLGDALPISLAPNETYALHISPNGISLRGNTRGDLMQALLETVCRIEAVCLDAGREELRLPCEERRAAAGLSFRGVHLCVFPQTDLRFLEKCLLTAALEKMTHAVVEFWGMLRYDCMQELAWSRAFDKAAIRPILDRARALGLEIIPMFNHLGHATAGRVRYGKHVVLDQNPRLAPLFTPDGWTWNIHSPKVRALLKAIRTELIEFCGKGSYFHLGCDEAYSYGKDQAAGAYLAAYLNEIAAELAAVGRRGIIWGDMLLCDKDFEKPYLASSETREMPDALIAGLSRNLILADWQYDAKKAPWETAAYFKKLGFDTLCCSWNTAGNIHAAVETVKSEGLYGLLHTTWHDLPKCFGLFAYAGACAFSAKDHDPRLSHINKERLAAANAVRRLFPAKGIYEDAGWAAEELTNPAP